MVGEQFQGDHSCGKPGEIREFKNGREKSVKKGKLLGKVGGNVFLHVVNYCRYGIIFETINARNELFT